MFTCGLCGVSTKPKQKASRIIVETREAIYPYRRAAHRVIEEGKRAFRDDPGGRGTEIAKEVLACPSCLAGKS